MLADRLKLGKASMIIRRDFQVFPGVHDEADKGWVWFYEKELKTRRTVRIANPATRKAIYCEYRALDHNFVTLYNEQPHSRNIEPAGTWFSAPRTAYRGERREQLIGVLVINEWYRLALGVLRTGRPVPLVVQQRRGLYSLWGGIKAGRHHPDPGIRMTTGLVILGTWLGVAGLLFAAISEKHRIWAWLGSGLAALISYVIGRGTRWSNE
jgi:hypothetical protein